MKKKLITIFLLCALTLSLCGCDSYTASDLRDAQARYYNGKYSREDERMVEGFNKWKADQDKYTD